MHNLLSNISIGVSEKTYLKNPETSDLGKKIIAGSIDMIDELGFERFTFRKLGTEISSTEASIYRYFESKHRLLLYLTSWFWGWMEYKMVFTLANIYSPLERLEKAISLLTVQVKDDNSFKHINMEKLNRIVIGESMKVYLTKEVDHENKEGVFMGYKQLVSRVSDIVLEINPNYKYPHMLVSTCVEGSHLQRYFAEHLPRLTDNLQGEDSITEFYREMVFKVIEE